VLADGLTERFLPSDAAVCQAEMRRLLRKEDGPTGFICRSRFMADAANAVFEQAGLKLYQDVDLVVCDYYLLPGQRPKYAFPRPTLTAEEQGKHLARLLAAQSRGESVPDELIPVHLDASAEELAT
jgi:DNA-binding LacI/PurR family transcriptional regulator